VTTDRASAGSDGLDAIHSSRVIHFERGFNVRDIGGLSGLDGRCIRRGKIYRSDDPYHVSARDAMTLAELGIRTVIDLRAPSESGERGSSTWDGLGATVHAFPVVPEVPPVGAHGNYLEPGWTAELYMKMLDKSRHVQVNLWRALAEGSSGVSVIHCYSGRDRTGVIIALLLELLGVTEEQIVADYAMSALGMKRMLAWYDLNIPGGADTVTSNRVAMVTTAPETMEIFLAEFHDRYGSAEEYATDLGIMPSVAELRRNLLDDA
jgi:hypothetical protein